MYGWVICLFTISVKIMVMMKLNIDRINKIVISIFKLFIAKISIKILRNKYKRVRRRIADEESCSLCCAVQETTIHVLRDYRYGSATWLKIISVECVFRFFELELNE